MDWATLLPAAPQAFLVCLARTTAIVSSIPVLGGRQAPMRAKAALAVCLSLAVFPLLDPEVFRLAGPKTVPDLVFLVARETLLGLIIGLGANLLFTAVSFGGTIIGYQMGFAAANIFDPQTTQQLSLMSQLQNVFAILLFLAFDGHHLFIRALVDSYRLLPPGGLDLSGDAVPFLTDLAADMFVLAVKFSAPILVLLLLSNMVLGLLSRIFPQLNVFILSFPVNIGLSFLVIGFTFGLAATLLRQEFDNLAHTIHQFLSLL